ncbi:hypothetical protein APHAL10511_006897 [Amanita phalloides]|nr:hypothetical protein APHAL10511_006897 [Amanita phalloides]
MSVWTDALKKVDQSPRFIKNDAPKKVYALPELALFVMPSIDEKKISYIMTWLRCQPAWLWQLEGHANTAVSSQMWQDLLGMNYNKATRGETAAGKRHDQIQKMMGNALNKPGVTCSSMSSNEPMLWCGKQLANDTMPPKEILHEIFWELYELSFRLELLVLDLCLSRNHDQQSIITCFPSSEAGITFVLSSGSNYRLVANDWHTCLRYITALVQVMCNWNLTLALPPAFQLMDLGLDTIME